MIVYKIANGIFEEVILATTGYPLSPIAEHKYRPLIAVLDAAADEDGDAYIKNVGVRVAYQDCVKYDFVQK